MSLHNNDNKGGARDPVLHFLTAKTAMPITVTSSKTKKQAYDGGGGSGGGISNDENKGEEWDNVRLSNPNIFCIRNNPVFKDNCAKLHQLRPGHLGPNFNIQEGICVQVAEIWSEAFRVSQFGAMRKYNNPTSWDFVLLYIKEGSDVINGVCALNFRAPYRLIPQANFAPHLFIDALAVEELSRRQNICRELCDAATELARLIWNDISANPTTNVWYAPEDDPAFILNKGELTTTTTTTNPFSEMFVALNVDKPDTKGIADIYQRLGFRIASVKEKKRFAFRGWSPSSKEWAVNEKEEFRMLKNI